MRVARVLLLAVLKIRRNLAIVTVEGGLQLARESGVGRHRPAGRPDGGCGHQGRRLGSGSSCHTPSIWPADQGR